MNLVYIALITCVLTTGCAASLASKPWIDISNEITNTYIKDVKNDGFNLYGFGGGMVDDIDLVIVHFDKVSQQNINDARMSYVGLMESLVCRYNQSLEARPYLHNFPFTHKNVKLTVRYSSKNGGFVPEEFITYVFCVNDMLHYCSYDPDPANPNGLKDVFKETYEQARRLWKDTNKQ